MNEIIMRTIVWSSIRRIFRHRRIRGPWTGHVGLEVEVLDVTGGDKRENMTMIGDHIETIEAETGKQPETTHTGRTTETDREIGTGGGGAETDEGDRLASSFSYTTRRDQMSRPLLVILITCRYHAEKPCSSA